jgi:hypothetical protein
MEIEIPYYVMHPSLGVTSVVYAPSTEKARTTFLDWLERKGYMNRSDRQQLRKNMVAKRLEDSNVQSDVVLHYGYQDTSSAYMPSGVPHEEDAEMLPEERSRIGEEVPSGEEVKAFLEDAYKDTGIDLRSKKEEPRMPIQKVMLRGFG